MTELLKVLFGGVDPKRRMQEVVSWVFPAGVFVAAFPMAKTGMDLIQWVMTALVLSVGVRVLIGIPIMNIKIGEKRLSDLRSMVSVIVGGNSWFFCFLMRDDLGWNWKVYLGSSAMLTLIAVYALAKEMKPIKNRGGSSKHKPDSKN